jgi:GT2 family glycosyltransferase
MDVSIIILNYNTFSLTSQCIQSIYQQTKGVDFEIILVDNASTECSPEKFLELFPEIKLVKNNENRGFAKGCNDGIKQAKGEYILLLNSDTVLLNDAISITSNFLKQHNNIGAATCRLENADTSPQNNCQPFFTLSKIIGEQLRIHKLFPKNKRGKIWWGPYFNYNETAYPDWVWATFFMFPKKILEIFPEQKLPETFWMYIEDMEWCWLIRKAGYKIAFVPEGRVLHYGGGDAHTDRTKKMMDKNFRKFYELYYGKTYATILLFLMKVLNWSQWRKWSLFRRK